MRNTLFSISVERRIEIVYFLFENQALVGLLNLISIINL